jgi:hypothetical protein
MVPGTAVSPATNPADARFDRPVVILSPPRSGSSLLFETLARAPDLCTVGGESHGCIECFRALHPVARGFDSNRLDAAAATPELAAAVRARFEERLRDRDGARVAPEGPVRLLEKTPKNALRIPFLRVVFPDAHFIVLQRDPRAVLGSMIDAWLSGRFRTYPNLPGWSGPPWSLVLVPGWRELAGRPLAEIVARQWDGVMRILLDDLETTPHDRIVRIGYEAFLADPATETRRLCGALGLAWDHDLGGALPLSRHTLSAPLAEKWRRHEHAIESAWPLVEATAARAARFFAA